MKNYGPVSIGTNIEHVEGVDNRHLTIVNQVVPEEQPQSASPETPAPSQVHLNTKRSTKLNFFRVIKALCDQGFFVDASGAKADDKDVFEALSPALNDDFSDYSGHLSEGLNHHKLDTRSEIFQKLRDTYEAYEMDLLEQRKNR
jgi:hypothetical protein